jgi:hypothetical protein
MYHRLGDLIYKHLFLIAVDVGKLKINGKQMDVGGLLPGLKIPIFFLYFLKVPFPGQ